MRNFIYLFVKNILKLILLNLLFIIFGIFVITIPASYVALTKTVWKILEDSEDVEKLQSVFRVFFKAFKNNFRQSMICGWLAVSICGGLCYGIWFYGAWYYAERSAFLQVFATVLLIIFLAAADMAAIMIGNVSLPTKAIIKNAFLLIPIKAVRAIGCAVFEVLVATVCVLQIHHLFPMILMIVFSLLAFIKVYLMQPVILKYICIYEVKKYE